MALVSILTKDGVALVSEEDEDRRRIPEAAGCENGLGSYFHFMASPGNGQSTMSASPAPQASLSDVMICLLALAAGRMMKNQHARSVPAAASGKALTPASCSTIWDNPQWAALGPKPTGF